MPVRASRLAERLVDGELVLYDPIRQHVHALNPTASFVWRACDGCHDEASIIAALAERYPDCREMIETDVADILVQFRAEGLLEL